MTWLEKMDAVLLCLDKLSGDNPTFDKLEKWLNEHYPKQIDKGEIQDITLYLWREQMMYFDDGGGWRLSTYDDRKPEGKYLLSCKGKMLRENPGGFVQQKIRNDAENSRVEKLETENMATQKNMVILTVILTVGTMFPALLALADLYKNYHWFQDAYSWWIFVLALVVATVTAYAVTKLLNRKR